MSVTVIGYTADADIWCLSCANRTYGVTPNGPDRLDHEGNTVHPIFSTDETSMEGEYCGRCHREVAEPWSL